MNGDNSLQRTTLQPDPHYADSVVPMGKRQELAAHIRALVAAHGDAIREQLATPEVAKEYCDTIRWGVTQRPPDRTCLNQYASIMKLVGEERRITVEFIHSLGVQSEEELKRYVDAAKSVEGAGPHDGAERCVAYLEAYLNAFPESRGTFVRRLGGLVPVEMG